MEFHNTALVDNTVLITLRLPVCKISPNVFKTYMKDKSHKIPLTGKLLIVGVYYLMLVSLSPKSSCYGKHLVAFIYAHVSLRLTLSVFSEITYVTFLFCPRYLSTKQTMLLTWNNIKSDANKKYFFNMFLLDLTHCKFWYREDMPCQEQNETKLYAKQQNHISNTLHTLQVLTKSYSPMMTSLYGNAFCITDTLWEESTSRRWIPPTRDQ